MTPSVTSFCWHCWSHSCSHCSSAQTEPPTATSSCTICSLHPRKMQTVWHSLDPCVCWIWGFYRTPGLASVRRRGVSSISPTPSCTYWSLVARPFAGWRAHGSCCGRTYLSPGCRGQTDSPAWAKMNWTTSPSGSVSSSNGSWCWSQNWALYCPWRC